MLALCSGCRASGGGPGDRDVPAEGEQSAEERARTHAWLRKHDPDVYTLLGNQPSAARSGLPEQGAPSPAPTPAQTTAPSVPLLPSYSPDIPPQLLFCDHKGFGRLTADAFEYYAVDDLRRLAKIDVPGSHNLIALMGNTSLVVARDHVYRYYHGQTEAVRFARIPILGPLQLWPDEQDIDSFWVRYLRDPDLHHFTLPKQGSEGLDSSVNFSQPKALPGFDGRRFVLLADGSALYSTADELVYASPRQPRRIPLTRFEDPIAAALASSRLDRIWVLTQAGTAALIELSRGLPERLRLNLAGTPLGFDARKKALAVVSAEQGTPTQHRLEVYEGKELRFSRPLPVLEADAQGRVPREVDNRSVCLFTERPWVLVGGRQVLQLFDYASGELLLQKLEP